MKKALTSARGASFVSATSWMRNFLIIAVILCLTGCATYQPGVTPLHSTNPFGPGYHPARGYPEVTDPHSSYWW